MKPELSLLVDGDQVPPAAVADHLKRLEADWRVTSRVCVRNWRSTKDVAAWKVAAQEMALQCLQRDPVATGKNAADVELAVIAMDQFHGLGYRAFCVISADTDFTPLVDRLRRAACHVDWVKDAGKGAPRSAKASDVGRRRSAAKAPAKAPATAAKPVKTPAAPKAEVAAKKAKATPEPIPDDDAAKQVRRAITALREAGKHDKGAVTVQQVGQWLKDQDIDRKRLGSRSNPLWKNLRRLPGIRVEEREDGRYWVTIE